MPTTVSLQRGSVTFTANGSSTSNITTLFTNSSSGIATRVIINYLTVNNPYVAPGAPMQSRNFQAQGFLGLVNGNAATIIGYMQGAVSGVSTTVGTMSATMAIADSSSPLSSTSNLGVNFINSAADSNQIGFQNQNPNNLQYSVGGGGQGYCPRTFWIGPSDSIRWWPRNSPWNEQSGKTVITRFVTQTLYYSFTLITES
jgi:hypothetical protein